MGPLEKLASSVYFLFPHLLTIIHVADGYSESKERSRCTIVQVSLPSRSRSTMPMPTPMPKYAYASSWSRFLLLFWVLSQDRPRFRLNKGQDDVFNPATAKNFIR